MNDAPYSKFSDPMFVDLTVGSLDKFRVGSYI